MKTIDKPLRVVHIPQVPMKGFEVLVSNEWEAFLISATLAYQHLFLYTNEVIPDYSNAIFVEMYEEGEWVDYWNDEELMDWEDLCFEYFSCQSTETGRIQCKHENKSNAPKQL